MQNDMCKNSGFCSRIQKSYNIFGIHSKFIAPPCFLGLTQIAQISQGFPLWVGNLTEALRFVVFCGLTQIQRDSTRRLFVGICVNSWQKKSLQKNICVIRGICGFKANPQIFMGHFRVQSRDFRRNPCRFRGF